MAASARGELQEHASFEVSAGGKTISVSGLRGEEGVAFSAEVWSPDDSVAVVLTEEEMREFHRGLGSILSFFSGVESKVN